MYNPCGGLQASAVRLEQADAFVNICHVTGSAWGNILRRWLQEEMRNPGFAQTSLIRGIKICQGDFSNLKFYNPCVYNLSAPL